jgi:hypothetical protein
MYHYFFIFVFLLWRGGGNGRREIGEDPKALLWLIGGERMGLKEKRKIIREGRGEDVSRRKIGDRREGEFRREKGSGFEKGKVIPKRVDFGFGRV